MTIVDNDELEEKISRLISKRPLTVETLSFILNERRQTISRRLYRLMKFGVAYRVTSRRKTDVWSIRNGDNGGIDND